jgi:hypothetical protein
MYPTFLARLPPLTHASIHAILAISVAKTVHSCATLRRRSLPFFPFPLLLLRTSSLRRCKRVLALDVVSVLLIHRTICSLGFMSMQIDCFLPPLACK